MKPTRLFGTDGIRAIAGEYPLDEGTVFLIGRALGEFLRRAEAKPRVVFGEDTRESSPWIAETLAAGLAREGVESLSAGVLPTPGVAYLSRSQGFSAGAMISASHNPYSDNGIKLFSRSGYKLPDQSELAVEQTIFRLAREQATRAPSEQVSPGGRLQQDASLLSRYQEFLCSLVSSGVTFAGLQVVLDCANGAASAVAPELFRHLGAEITATHVSPNGRNINLDCGALHPESLQARVPAERANLGVAFDGDADRALFVTADGDLVDGDGVLFLVAKHMLAQGRLKSRLVVGTIMSNLGLEATLGASGIHLRRTPVGDKYVLEEMQRCGANLGGEQSGHVIFGGDHTTGDGLLTALRVLEIVTATGRPLGALVSELKPFPQVIQNVPVREKVPLEELPEVWAAIRSAQEQIGLTGRVIVRYSGTESLARIMIEGETEAEVSSSAELIAAAFYRTIGT